MGKQDIKTTTVRPTGNSISGGDGRGLETAVTITAKTTRDGLALENVYISDLYGIRGVSWMLIRQEHVMDGLAHYDIVHIRTSTGAERSIYFDVSSFFGKR